MADDGRSDPALRRKYAAELAASAPDVIVATANSIVLAAQEASRTIPIVFVTTIDPVGGGLVTSLARPGGNATGFTAFEFSLNAKLLELLREIAPGVTRAAVIRDPAVSAGSGFSNLNLTVVADGNTLINQNFNQAQAVAEFTNDAIDLGSLSTGILTGNTLNLTITETLTTTSAGTNFYGGFLVGGSADRNNRAINDVEPAWGMYNTPGGASVSAPNDWSIRDYLYQR